MAAGRPNAAVTARHAGGTADIQPPPRPARKSRPCHAELSGSFCGTPRHVSHSWARDAAGARLRGASSHLRMPETTHQMVVDHAGGLHERVTDRRSYEGEAALPQVLAHRVRLFGARGNVLSAPPAILQGRS